jgi:putative spermidine/putrescine transport system permease protein
MKSRITTTLLIIVFLLPLAVLLIYSFSGRWEYPRVIPSEVSFRAFRYVAGQGNTLVKSILSSAGFSLTSAVLSFVLCLAPASILAYKDFPGKSLLEGILLLPAVLPAMAFAVGAHLMFLLLGVADTWIGVVIILTVYSYPYMLHTLVVGYAAIGPDYRDCALNLGRSRLGTRLTVEIPLLLPSILTGGIVVFLVAFSEYFLVFLIGGGIVPSVTGHLVPFLLSSDFPTASLLVLIFSLLPLVLLVSLEAVVDRAYRRREGRAT